MSTKKGLIVLMVLMFSLCTFVFAAKSTDTKSKKQTTKKKQEANVSNDDPNSTWPYKNETKQQRDARMEWWRDARFGMFIHWGVYSVPAGVYDGNDVKGIGEWIMNRGKIPVARYQEYAKDFNPVKYDPDAWVKLAKEAGMKYIVITSKHHDGFALFDSKVTDWDVVDATPYGKDLLKPLAAACKKYGIKLGFYYSQAQDWHHPGGAASGGHWDKAQDGDMTEYIKKIAAPQVKEILGGNYGKISVLWWDTPTDMTRQRADLLQPLITLQPGIITNNRLGGGYRGDLETPEQKIPATGLNYDWETCMTMNNTWGYKSKDNNWKSTETLIRNLVDASSKGGNYLLNVGPTSLGEIPQPSIERLQQIGVWMKSNSDSIYATTASPFTKLTWGRCTKKIEKNGATLYLHVFQWPTDGKLTVPGLKNEVKKAYLLENKKTLTTSVDQQGVIVDVPQQALNPIDTVVVLEVKGDLKIEKVLPKQNAQGVITLPAKLANIENFGYSEHARIEKIDGFETITNWTEPKATVQWDFTVDKPGTFDIVATVASQDGSAATITVAKEKVSAKIPATGDVYQDVQLGSVKIEKAGDYSLQIKPSKKWKAVNLRSIELKKADEAK